MIDPSAADQVIASRLLILQSKRLMLANAERKMGVRCSPDLQERIDRLTEEADDAMERYRGAVLRWAPSADKRFWVVAYSKLIEVASGLLGRLKEAAPRLSAAERYEMSTDIEVLELAIGRWTDGVRAAMAADSVA